MKYYIKIGLEHFAFGLIIPISIIWKLSNGLSLAEAAATEALILLVTSIAEVPTGIFADKFGNKKSLVWGGLLRTIAVALMAYGGGLAMFAIAAVVSGVAWAFTSGADQAYIHDDLLKDKGKYRRVFANATMVDEATTIVGMLFSGLMLAVVSGSDLRLLFMVAGAFLALSVAYMFIFLPDGHKKAAAHHESALIGFKDKLHDSKELLVMFLAFALIYESGRVLWQPQLENLGLELSKFGIMFALFKLASLAGSFAARGHRFKLRWVILSFLVMSISLILFGVDVFAVSAAALTVFLFTENYFRVYMSDFLNRVITKDRATFLSVSSLVTNVTGAALVFAAGYFGENSILLALVILVALKTPGFMYVLRKHNAVFTRYRQELQ
ncbi:hypothetical protein CR983_00010 [Candidatus Saccharibacteria bacterium]|nr:MAG: hypothetical protein CR983_00010 [Candidatus Saccharibacteria bacterium]